MKIKKITAYPVKLQLKEPFVISNVTNFDMYYVIVQIQTDNGLVGYGEATPAWEVTGETYQSVLATVKLFSENKLIDFSLLNQDISSLENIRKLVDALEPISYPKIIYGNASAKAAIEQAVLDCYGQYAKIPIYRIFGGRPSKVPAIKAIGIFDIKTTLEKVREALQMGYKTIRLKVGKRDYPGNSKYERDIRAIKEVHASIKERKIRLVADANQGLLTIKSAVYFCKEVENYLDWLEQPTLASDLSAFREIKKKTNIPLMADESVKNIDDLKLMIKLGGIDFINVKLMKSGGMIRALDMIDLANRHSIGCQIGSMIENSLGAAMGIHTYLSRSNNIVNTDLQAFSRLKKNIGDGIKLSQGFVEIGEAPGNGVRVSLSEIKKYKV